MWWTGVRIRVYTCFTAWATPPNRVSSADELTEKVHSALTPSGRALNYDTLMKI